MALPLSFKAWASALVILIMAAPSYAAPITTLFSTGVGEFGTPLPNNAAELHYSLVNAPAGSVTSLRVATAANGFPIPPWVGDNATSAWIGPNSGSSLDGPVGDYTYRTTFTLAGFIASTASIAGQWAVDNTGIDILLNGVSTGISNPDGFSAFKMFSLSSGFVDGLNTIDFVVNNAGGPTGLRVDLVGTATASVPVPEPASLIILGGTLLGLGLVRRRRAQRSTT